MTSARFIPISAGRWHDGKRKLSDGCCSQPPGQPKLARIAADSTPDDVTPRRDVIRCECDVSGDAASGDRGDRVSDYLSRSRINLNVRQVFPRGLMLKPEDS